MWGKLIVVRKEAPLESEEPPFGPCLLCGDDLRLEGKGELSNHYYHRGDRRRTEQPGGKRVNSKTFRRDSLQFLRSNLGRI